MALKVTIAVAGTKELSRSLAVVTKDIKDLRPAWNEIEKILNSFQQRVFRGKGKAASARWFGVDASADLKKWQALKPATVREKSRLGYARNASFPLIRTEKLMNAFSKNNAPGAVRVKLPKVFIWGIDEGEIPYALYHHLGGSKIPKRPVLRLPNNLRKIIVKAIQKHLASSGQLIRSRLGQRLGS